MKTTNLFYKLIILKSLAKVEDNFDITLAP